MTTNSTPVLDFEPRRVDADAAARTRRLLHRVLASHGPQGLARSLHVSSSQAAGLKHRVACITCRSRLDVLAQTLASATSASTASSDAAAADGAPPPPPEGPAPLTAWLAADGGRGLAPAPRALCDLGALAAFLTGFGFASSPTACEEISEEASRRSGRTGIVRCQYHATCTVARAASMATVLPGFVAGAPQHDAAAAAAGSAALAMQRERERFVSLLRSGTSEAEWRTLGTVNIDDAMCDLFTWLGDRGLCSSCVDAVTGALLEVRRTVTATTATVCNCPRCCRGKCSPERPIELPVGPPANSVAGSPPELMRVTGRLRAICGVYRLETMPFNGHAVYKKERAEAYLLYTSLKDWMISGKADAGGAKCEGLAYVTDLADTPDEICGVWKVSGPRGWEEDPTLCVTAFEGLPQELRAGIGYDDGSAIARRLAADDRGVLLVPLQEAEVLEEVLWVQEEPPPGRSRSGACIHILSAEAAQCELRCWLRWLLRDRLDVQLRRILAQAQVGASLCRIFACAALQQLEQAAEAPAPGARRTEKKGRAKKGGKAARDAEAAEDAAADGASAVGTEGSSSSSLAASPIAKAKVRLHTADSASDESASTRASSEEPPDERSALEARKARRLMQQMGWRPEASRCMALDGAEVAAWCEQHPRYRQAIREERLRLQSQFQQWARDGSL